MFWISGYPRAYNMIEWLTKGISQCDEVLLASEGLNYYILRFEWNES